MIEVRDLREDVDQELHYSITLKGEDARYFIGLIGAGVKVNQSLAQRIFEKLVGQVREP